MTTAPASTPRAARLVVLVQRLHQALGEPAPGLLGRCERAALDAAVALARGLGGTLTALSMGTEEHQGPVLAAARAAGCDAAVRVHAPDCDDLDYLGVATILGAAARTLGCDALLCGDSSENERTGAVGPAVAEILGVPHLTGVLAIAAERKGARAWAPPAGTAGRWGASDGDGRADEVTNVMVQHRSGGRIHRLRWPLPAVFCLLAPDVPANVPANVPASVRADVPASGSAAAAPDSEAAARPASDDAAARPGTEAAAGPLTPLTPLTTITTLTLAAIGLDARALAHRRRLAGRAHTDAVSGATIVASAGDLVARLVAEGILH